MLNKNHLEFVVDILKSIKVKKDMSMAEAERLGVLMKELNMEEITREQFDKEILKLQ